MDFSHNSRLSLLSGYNYLLPDVKQTTLTLLLGFRKLQLACMSISSRDLSNMDSFEEDEEKELKDKHLRDART